MRCVALPLNLLYRCKRVLATVALIPALTTRPLTFPGRSFARIFSSLLALVTLLLSTSHPTHALPLTEEDELPPTHVIANHVVISEVQVSGSAENNEFIELYNPTGSPVDLTGWRLARRTAAATIDTDLISSFPSGKTIPAWGFFLIAHQDYATISPAADQIYSASALADNNSALLYRPNGSGGWILVDLIGWGTAQTVEGFSFPQNPTNNRSIERKAFLNSTVQNMVNGGTHSVFGNSYDSNNNSQDFVRRVNPVVPDTSNPQNSASNPERCCTTITGTLTQQGRADHTGTEVLLWPGSNLRTTTDSNGYFSIPNVPAIASEDTTEYNVEATFAGYLPARTTLDLTAGSLSNDPIIFSTLRLLAGDINGDNQVNIFDLAIIGSQYGSVGISSGDVNGDGQVNIQDLSLVSGNFGRSTSQYNWLP